MKKITAVICIAALLLSCMVFTGCAPKGLAFFSIKQLKELSPAEYKETGLGDLTVLTRYSDVDGLICLIKDDAPSALTIPAEYKEKPVVAVIGVGKTPEGVKNVTIEDGVKAIENCFVFAKAGGEFSVTLPSSIEYVKDSFRNAGMESVTFPGKVYEIKDSFKNCNKLKKLEFKGDVTTINSDSFLDCAHIESIVFGGKVENIGDEAFASQSELKSVAFNGDVKNIGEDAFSNCTQLSSITFGGDIETINYRAFNYAAVTEMSFPGAIDLIYGFNYCDSLTSVVFDGDVVTLGYGAFDFCPALTDVTINGTIQTLDADFEDCEALEWVTVPEGTKAEHDIKDTSPKALVGPKPMVDLAKSYDIDALAEQAKTKLGANFTANKKIEASKAKDYGAQITGPVFATKKCADCNYSNYSASKIASGKELTTYNIDELEEMFPGTVYTKDKANAVLSGDKPLVYCLIEQIGFSEPETYGRSDGSSSKKYIFYYLYYRISLWDADSGEVVAWFTFKTGYDPTSFNLGQWDKYVYTVQTDVAKRDCFNEKNNKHPSPTYVFGKYFYNK